MTLSAGVYRFSGVHDDGMRAYIDNTAVVDQWTFGHEQYSVDKVVASGTAPAPRRVLRGRRRRAGRASTTSASATSCADDGGWAAEYFDNRDLAGAPVVTRTDDAIDFDWSSGSPADAVPANNFSARWTKSLHLAEAGAYKFTITSDDGARLFVDGQRVLDKWNFQSRTTQHCQLAARRRAQHQIVLEYFEASGDAVAKLELRADDRPRSAPRVAAGRRTRPSTSRTATSAGTPITDAQRRRDRLRLGRRRPGRRRARGQLLGALDKAAERLRGSARTSSPCTADDGVRLFVDGQKVLDKWTTQGRTTFTVTR